VPLRPFVKSATPKAETATIANGTPIERLGQRRNKNSRAGESSKSQR
jgi:hypothetical protein